MKYLKLNNGVEIPMLGFGVYLVADGDECKNAVSNALESGYRHIDTAALYNNEASVGQAIKESGIPREEIFVTTKVWNDSQRSNEVQAAFDDSINKLGFDYVDLYLIHWPVKECFVNTWLELEKIYKSGRARAIGVSNFKEHQIEDLRKVWSVVPVLNQVELHPMLTQKNVINYCKGLDIAVQSWAPLGGRRESCSLKDNLLDNEVLVNIGKKYGKSAAQVVLRWNIDLGLITIPKSTTPSRIKENIDIFDFQLDADDIKAIDALNQNQRVGADPDTFDF